jgi:hypothetical protein
MTDVASEFLRPAALQGVYRPSDRGIQGDDLRRSISHKKDLSQDLERMVAHCKLDGQVHDKCRVWAKLHPTASKGLKFEESRKR